jgi:hypothetical protein
MDQTRTFLPLPPDIAGSDELRPLVERANGWLDEQIPKWPTPLTVEWSGFANSGPEGVVALRLDGQDGKASGVFAANVLQDRSEFRTRLFPVIYALIDDTIRGIRRGLEESNGEAA